MLTIQEVNRAIMLQEWTNIELSSMIDAVKWNREQLSKRIKRSIGVGDTVNFTSSKTGRNVTGTVMKVAIKYVTVRTIDGLWRVPANMLRVVDTELA
jgi:small-conductance mechanosensitive channel